MIDQMTDTELVLGLSLAVVLCGALVSELRRWLRTAPRWFEDPRLTRLEPASLRWLAEHADRPTCTCSFTDERICPVHRETA